MLRIFGLQSRYLECSEILLLGHVTVFYQIMMTVTQDIALYLPTLACLQCQLPLQSLCSPIWIYSTVTSPRLSFSSDWFVFQGQAGPGITKKRVFLLLPRLSVHINFLFSGTPISSSVRGGDLLSLLCHPLLEFICIQGGDNRDKEDRGGEEETEIDLILLGLQQL